MRFSFDKALVPLLGAVVLSSAALSGVAGVKDVDSRVLTSGGCTVKLRVDVTDGAAHPSEVLYEIGPMRLTLRRAGSPEWSKDYDLRQGNYFNFPLADGTCPVLEATIPGRSGRVGIPIGALSRPSGVHDVTLNLSPVHWTICVDGLQDDDMPPVPVAVAWPDVVEEKIHSRRVKHAEFFAPALPDALPKMPDSRRIERSVQYWTPRDPNAWVGDVVLGMWKGRFHLFYLFDRRHHHSGANAGRHFFAHMSSADLVHWDEHPHALTNEKWWETMGTGTPFDYQGKLYLAYGLHTPAVTNSPAYPKGGTYAYSEDGIHFTKSNVIFHKTQNPTIFNYGDGLLWLIAGHSGMGGIWTSDRLDGWKPLDMKVPARGDCPCLVVWNGHHYLFQGFDRFAYSPTGAPGSWVDWAKEGLAPYEGLCVPMVAPFGDNRRIMAGWLTHPSGWGWMASSFGGWLVFRELVQHSDGTLGTKWVPEIKPPTSPRTYTVQPGREFKLVFPSADGKSPAHVFAIDPSEKTMSFSEDVESPNFGYVNNNLPWHTQNIRVGNCPAYDKPYEVKVVSHYDRKGDTTIFDAEVGAERTIISRRAGRFQNPQVKGK